MISSLQIKASDIETITFTIYSISFGNDRQYDMIFNIGPCAANVLSTPSLDPITKVLTSSYSETQLPFSTEGVNLRFTSSINGCEVLFYELYEGGTLTTATSDVKINTPEVISTASLSVKTGFLNLKRSFKLKAIGAD